MNNAATFICCEPSRTDTEYKIYLQLYDIGYGIR